MSAEPQQHFAIYFEIRQVKLEEPIPEHSWHRRNQLLLVTYGRNWTAGQFHWGSLHWRTQERPNHQSRWQSDLISVVPNRDRVMVDSIRIQSAKSLIVRVTQPPRNHAQIRMAPVVLMIDEVTALTLRPSNGVSPSKLITGPIRKIARERHGFEI